MTGARAAVTLAGGTALLERALGYLLGRLDEVSPAQLRRPTPCRDWDLRALLAHLDDSLAALQEAVVTRHIGPGAPYPASRPDAPGGPPARPSDARGADTGVPGGREPGCPEADFPEPGDREPDPVARLRRRACGLLGALAGAKEHLVWVGGYPVPASIAASAGAVDVAVHGWDVAWACRDTTPIPDALAADLLGIAPLLVTAAERPLLFAAPRPADAGASPGDRLIAFLGRDPLPS